MVTQRRRLAAGQENSRGGQRCKSWEVYLNREMYVVFSSELVTVPDDYTYSASCQFTSKHDLFYYIFLEHVSRES